MKKKRGVYIDPLWAAMVLVGVAIGLMIGMIKSAKAVQQVVVREVTVQTTRYIQVPAVQETQAVLPEQPGVVVVKDEEEYEFPTEKAGEQKGDLELLALVIYQEAGGDACSDETRQMVGEVVLNRVADKRYPCTIEGVITQQAQYGRLHWTGPVWPERHKNPGEQHAVERAYETARALLIEKTDRLLPEDVIYQAEFRQGVEVVAEADGFYFCR